MTNPKIARPIETVLWVLGLLCVGAYVVTKEQSARAQSAAISRLEVQWQLEAGDKPDQSLWSKQRIAQHERARSELLIGIIIGWFFRATTRISRKAD